MRLGVVTAPQAAEKLSQEFSDWLAATGYSIAAAPTSESRRFYKLILNAPTGERFLGHSYEEAAEELKKLAEIQAGREFVLRLPADSADLLEQMAAACGSDPEQMLQGLLSYGVRCMAEGMRAGRAL